MKKRTSKTRTAAKKPYTLPPEAQRRFREVRREQEAREVEAARWSGPHCLDCRSERISYVYMDRINGEVIDEASAFSMVANIIGEAIDHETEDPSWLSELAHAQYELACMWKVRPDPRTSRGDEGAE